MPSAPLPASSPVLQGLSWARVSLEGRSTRNGARPMDRSGRVEVRYKQTTHVREWRVGQRVDVHSHCRKTRQRTFGPLIAGAEIQEMQSGRWTGNQRDTPTRSRDDPKRTPKVQAPKGNADVHARKP